HSPCPALFPYTTLFRSRSGLFLVCSWLFSWSVFFLRWSVFFLRRSVGRTGGLTLLTNDCDDSADINGVVFVCLNFQQGTGYWRRSEEHTSELQSRFDLV